MFYFVRCEKLFDFGIFVFYSEVCNNGFGATEVGNNCVLQDVNDRRAGFVQAWEGKHETCCCIYGCTNCNVTCTRPGHAKEVDVNSIAKFSSYWLHLFKWFFGVGVGRFGFGTRITRLAKIVSVRGHPVPIPVFLQST